MVLLYEHLKSKPASTSIWFCPMGQGHFRQSMGAVELSSLVAERRDTIELSRAASMMTMFVLSCLNQLSGTRDPGYVTINAACIA